MTIKTETKKVSDMTEKELEQKILDTVSKTLFAMASEIGKLNEMVLFLTENKVSPR